MKTPELLRDKPLTQDLVSSMRAIVDSRRENRPATAREQVRDRSQDSTRKKG